MDDRNRQLGASTTAPALAPPCTECRGFNVPALVRGRYQRGTCPACGGAGTAEAQQARSVAQVACATDGDFGHVVEPEPEPNTARLQHAPVGVDAIDPQDYDPELAAALAGADFIHWHGAGPDDAPIQFGAHCPCSAQDAAMTLQCRINQALPRADRVRTLVLLLRTHGADVREVP